MINTFWKIFQSSSSLSSCQNAQVAQQFRRQFEKCPNTIKLCKYYYYKVRCLSLHPHLSCPRLAKRFPVREEAELAESENIVRKSVILPGLCLYYYRVVLKKVNLSLPLLAERLVLNNLQHCFRSSKCNFSPGEYILLLYSDDLRG